MTKFMDPSFSTYAPGDDSYRDNWEATFGKKATPNACKAADGFICEWRDCPAHPESPPYDPVAEEAARSSSPAKPLVYGCITCGGVRNPTWGMQCDQCKPADPTPCVADDDYYEALGKRGRKPCGPASPSSLPSLGARISSQGLSSGLTETGLSSGKEKSPDREPELLECGCDPNLYGCICYTRR